MTFCKDWFNATDFESGCEKKMGAGIFLPHKKYGEMVQLFSACPYSFCGGRRWFVLSQFRTRYCGHTLSRLAKIRHNRTKHDGFPTIRRKESEESEYNSGLVRLLTLGGLNEG
jgi:hypothetical protein